MKKKADPARVTRAQDEVNDRKTGLHIAKWTLHFTRIGTMLSALAVIAAAVGIYLTIHYANQSDAQSSSKTDPAFKVVINPDVGTGGEPVYALPLPNESEPVDYLAGGALTSIDCQVDVQIARNGDYYEFVRIAEGEVDAGRWIEVNKLVMQDGNTADSGLKRVPKCP